MKQKFSDDEINAIILKHLKGQSINSICKEYKISIATFYRWKNKHFSVTEDVLKLLQKLEIDDFLDDHNIPIHIIPYRLRARDMDEEKLNADFVREDFFQKYEYPKHKQFLKSYICKL